MCLTGCSVQVQTGICGASCVPQHTRVHMQVQDQETYFTFACLKPLTDASEAD